MKRVLIFTFLVQLMFPLNFKIYGQISTNGSQVKNVGEPTFLLFPMVMKVTLQSL